MGINPEFAGRVYPPSPVYEVGREKIREFAEAVGAGHPAHRDPQAARALGYADVIAPPTFAVIAAQRCEQQLIVDPEAGSTSPGWCTARRSSATTGRSPRGTGWSAP
jgi:hypothetical protein